MRAGGEIPSRSRALGAGLSLLAGRWEDAPADSAYIAPTPQQLYDELDRFHRPHRSDSTWAEWHYFNVVSAPDEWWYISYVVRGNVPAGRGAGVLLITRRRADGRYERFTATEPPERVTFDTTGASGIETARRSRRATANGSPGTSYPRWRRRRRAGSASPRAVPFSRRHPRTTTITGGCGAT